MGVLSLIVIGYVVIKLIAEACEKNCQQIITKTGV